MLHKLYAKYVQHKKKGVFEMKLRNSVCLAVQGSTCRWQPRGHLHHLRDVRSIVKALACRVALKKYFDVVNVMHKFINARADIFVDR